ncbi:hypothetical protein L484_016164 [Morus notabilis]|uniref:ASCH domain-containing protein n=1 Tax=Morus notabilis TaxID=981085 RepID=W9QWJ8_9ROSA|nr:uncharacterized protein LOC21399226 isoform X2 [Morus notabilis]EXB23147.1 hypothetical protein L484_016164 [Morus notabilis]
MSTVNLRNCTEELLKYTIQSRISETLEFDIGLSEDFCSRLLNSDPCDDPFPASHSTDSMEGVPPHPLYKHLAYALQQSMTSGTFYRTYNRMPMIGTENSLKQKEHFWQKLISEKGSEFVNVLRTIDLELYVEEPFFSQMKDGLKTIEGRCATGKYSRIKSGSLILLNECLLFEVQDVHWYASFSKMLEAEGLAEVLPGVKSIIEGVEIYRKFYTKEKEMSNGVLAISISKVDPQPYTYLAAILSGLNYGGVQGLLGLTNTNGTIEHALPPPRSALVSSFMMPYKIDAEVKGITLTHGAQALAKHAHRCTNKYWGTLNGNDSDKNRRALDVITQLITQCCWLNLHIVPPHGDVFEIRVADGYGARWSIDGSKFVGFLEPYVEDGHSTGWKH